MLPSCTRALLAAGLAVTAGCSGGGGGGSSGSTFANGDIVENPDPGIATYFVVEKGQGGTATSLGIDNVFWGRLVTIKDYDAATGTSRTVFRDFLIGDDIANDGINYRLDRDAVTEEETLTILHAFDSANFRIAFDAVDDNLQVFQDKSLDPSELPPFTAVPRNAALMVKFDDLLNDGGNPGDPQYPGSVSDATVRLLVQNPPTTPFEGRVIPDPNHGDLIGGTFHSTRVIIDLTVSENEALQTNLPVNSLGLPAASTVAVPNAVLRIPTEVDSGAQQFEILTNLANKGVSFTGNGSTLPTVTTLDVVRAFRSMGVAEVTGDPNNGFLPDDIPPVLLGAQVVAVAIDGDPLVSGPFGAGGDEFIVDVHFELTACAISPRIGDVLDLLPDFRAQVIQQHVGSVGSGVATGVRIQLLRGDPATFATAINLDGQFKTSFNPAFGHDPRCFVRFLPTESSPPGDGVALNASMVITFSEPIDPQSVQPFDSFTVSYDTPPIASLLYKRVVGHVVPSTDLRKFTFEPEVDLRHTQGQADGYTLEVLGGASGVTDLAGNGLINELAGTSAVSMHVDAAAPTFNSGSVSLRFDSSDEDGDGNPEVRGQFFFDLGTQSLRPRALARFSAVADPSQPVVSAMIALPGTKLQTPLSNHGSKLMCVWRYHDVGFGLLDDANHNLDVEGLNWAPFNNTMQVDNFSRFQMSLAHCKFLPDEELSSGLLPNWPASGLVQKFEDNLVNKLTDPLTIVHPALKGYTVNPGDAFVAASTSNFTMTPWPMNQGIDLPEYTYWTWRDTAKTAVGAPNGNGADTQRLQQITKVANTGFYPVGKVPTIGLPLLMEYRTYPDSLASAQNGFRIAIAINSSANPYFRTFSTGYVTCTSQVVTDVNPDTAVIGAGGYDPVACVTTNARDNTFYYGQADFVVRVSRLHTAWFDTGAGSRFVTPVVAPGPSSLPAGTQLVLAFRGATAMTPSTNTSWKSATFIDSYGDAYTSAQLQVFGHPSTVQFTPTYVGGSSDSWKTAVTQLNPTGSAPPTTRYFQTRVSFLGNPETAQTPELSALGFAFYR